uniref:Uncharacterized protein LOC114346413 n=1 Tax=Diabrotica virgifera virgifera TaxID=50390 RepID=A0A6P7H5H9_DIAVI
MNLRDHGNCRKMETHAAHDLPKRSRCQHSIDLQSNTRANAMLFSRYVSNKHSLSYSIIPLQLSQPLNNYQQQSNPIIAPEPIQPSTSKDQEVWETVQYKKRLRNNESPDNRIKKQAVLTDYWLTKPAATENRFSVNHPFISTPNKTLFSTRQNSSESLEST